MLGILLAGGAAAVVAALALRSSMEVVMAYEQRALEVRGEFRRMLAPGLHFVPPFVSETHSVDRRAKSLAPEPPGALSTRDGTPADVEVTVEYSIDDARAAYDELGADPHRAVENAAAGALRDAVGDASASALRENPDAVADAVETAVSRLRPGGVDLEGVTLEAVDVGDGRPAGPD